MANSAVRPASKRKQAVMYKTANRLAKNKLRKVTRHVKSHPKDVQNGRVFVNLGGQWGDW